MPGHYFVHRIDPILFTLGGVHSWWYGLSYALGFVSILRALLSMRTRLALTPHEVFALALCVCLGVLVGGRFVEVMFDEQIVGCVTDVDTRAPQRAH